MPDTDDKAKDPQDSPLKSKSYRVKNLRVSDLPPEEKTPKKKRNFVYFIAYFSIAVVVLTVALMGVIGYIMLRPLPDISYAAIERRSSQPSVILAVDGSVLAQWHGDTERIPLRTQDFPQVMFDATVAIEDQRFFEHSGLDLRSIIRAVQRNWEAGQIMEGGSTITMQLMKMMYAGAEQSMARKIEEAILASRLEMESEKEDILAAYLNMAFFGQGAYGLAAAADIYFGVEPSELSLSQAATLAGILHMPSAYQPHDNPEPLLARRNLVLNEMFSQHLITELQLNVALESDLDIQPAPSRVSDVRFPFFVDYVQRELPNILPEERIAQGGLVIHTTLDPALQLAAEEAAATFNDEEEGPTVSMVSMRHSDGAILALIGGKDWDEKQFNVAVQARRQPGSAFKPLTLIAAMEAGVPITEHIDASVFETIVRDEVWTVTNYGGGASTGTMDLRAAMVASINTVYARLIMEVGPQNVVDLAYDLGFGAEMEPDPALALGGLRYGVSPLEMARAYTTIAKAGLDIEPRAITRVTAQMTSDSAVQVLYEAPADAEAVTETRIFSQETGTEVRSVLREAVTQGTGRRANVEGTAISGKTGTTQNYHDAWFVGWGEGVTTSVWMGFPEAQIEMRDIRGRNVSGGSYPAQIFHDFMVSAIELRPSSGMVYIPGMDFVPEEPDEPQQYASPYFDDEWIIPTLEEIGREDLIDTVTP